MAGAGHPARVRVGTPTSPAMTESVIVVRKSSRGALVGGGRLDAEQVNRAVFVLYAPAAAVGQVSRFRAVALEPADGAFTGIGGVEKAGGNHGARTLGVTLTASPADTDDAIHVLLPL
jgi:hypothetical protein